MKPPSGGPITGPTSAGTVTHAIALTSALLSIERSSTSLPTGVIMAPPAPCTIRAITNWVTEEDSAQPIEPTMNTAMAIENTARAPKRSAVQPLAGMNTASDSRYEVMASFSVSGLVPISAAIAGSEVAMTVESMFSMNRATATISGTMRFADMGLGLLDVRVETCAATLAESAARGASRHCLATSATPHREGLWLG